MIIPNLMVETLKVSMDFYTKIFGMSPLFIVTSDHEVVQPNEIGDSDYVFTIMEKDKQQIMLQRSDSLRAGLSAHPFPTHPTFTGTLYFRDFDLMNIQDKVGLHNLLKGPVTQWYGMEEIYFNDPDGYVICVGQPSANPPK